MALQLATLQRCYYDIIAALLVNDGTATLLLLQHYCSTMALQRYCYCGTTIATLARDTTTLWR